MAEAVLELRFAQELILSNLTLPEEIDGFQGSLHQDPIWGPTREPIERLTATRDWAEQWFVTAAVVEPLVGELFRSGFVMQVAALHGDFVTPTVMGRPSPTRHASRRAPAPSTACSSTTPRTARRAARS